MLEADFDGDKLAATVRFGCRKGVRPAAVRKHLRSLARELSSAKKTASNSQDGKSALIERLYTRRMLNSVRWSQEKRVLRADFPVDVIPFLIPLYSLARNANDTFDEVSEQLGNVKGIPSKR